MFPHNKPYTVVLAIYNFCLCGDTGHSVWNLRTKTPQNEQTTVPWHQDNAYLDQDALGTLMPTAWIPLLDANTLNGCMQVSRLPCVVQVL